jgi:hypothetical protein
MNNSGLLYTYMNMGLPDENNIRIPLNTSKKWGLLQQKDYEKHVENSLKSLIK